MFNHFFKWLFLLFLFMNSLHINQFKGSEAVELNKTLTSNRIFYSKVNDFEGTLVPSHFSLKIPISGIEDYVVGGRKYQVDENSYLLTNIDQDIEAQVKSDKDVIGLCVGFSKAFMLNLEGSMHQNIGEGLDRPFDTNGAVNFITKKNRLNEDALSLALRKFKLDFIENRIHDSYEEEQFYLFLGELLIGHQLKIYSDIKRLPHAKMSTRQEVYRRVCLMNDYIHDNYKTHISLDKLSQVSSLSKFHAIRSYQMVYHISPYKQIQMLRLVEAKRLITLGESLKDVANETNFTDHRALSKLFKKYFNMTPTEFRIKNS